MKLASVNVGDKPVGVCKVDEDHVVALADLVPGVSSLTDLIAAGDDGMRRLQAALAAETKAPRAARLAISELTWQAPIVNPQKIFCLALNNGAMDHYAIELAKYPAYFEKPVSSLTGHRHAIELQAHYGLTHPEPELGVIIGRPAKHVAVADAMKFVFGYTIINDITSPGMRKEDHFHFRFPYLQNGANDFRYVEEHTTYPARYKGCDTFAPMGPWLVTKDEIANPHALNVRCWLDDDLIMDDNTKNMRFSVAQVIHWISAHGTLQPGDIVSMGTALHPDVQARPISYGDMNKFGKECRIEISQIGVLSNPIERGNAPDPRKAFQG